MSVVLPMVKESQTSGGTSDLTGCAAVTNFWRGDNAPGGAINRRFDYWIRDGTLHERGVGYKSSTTVFVRETTLGNSSGTTAKINFTSAAIITSMEQPGMVPTFPAIYSEDGDALGLATPTTSRPNRSSTINADRLYCQGAVWMGKSPVSEVGVDVITDPGADVEVYIGFYEIGANGEPGEVLSEANISIPNGGTGIHSASIVTPVLFRKVFMSFIADTAFTTRAYNDRDLVLLDGQLGSSTDEPYSLLYAASSSPTALPDPAPTSWTPVKFNVGIHPCMFALYWG